MKTSPAKCLHIYRLGEEVVKEFFAIEKHVSERG
jgi:hypothetical protein